ncbi:copper resistance CopC family protein [Bacillus sp. USDA818B3_A]|uniref:copper resistance CopC family protein n=1 Tax=Bacillus sp. USDA818B3_A TaxID=2698834 RepID=UPI001F2E7867|nr:copper resistance CopC family protein [Bacillus sp. USDA818B3_A]
MKKLLFLLISTLLFIPTIVSAHTELTVSNPANGAVVKEDLKEIVLTYEGEIESLSTMKLLKEGQEITFTSVTPQENKLIGTLSSPLENGAYTIQWNIAGEDGHPLSGEITFNVEKEAAAVPNTNTEQPETKTKEEEPKKETSTETKANNEANQSSSSVKTAVTLAIVVVLLLGAFLLFRRKR